MMEERFVDAQKYVREKEELQLSLKNIKLVEDIGSEYEESKAIRPLQVNPRQPLTFDILGRFVVQYPLESIPGNVVITPVGKLIVGTAIEKENAWNIPKSSLFYNQGTLDNNASLARVGSIDVKGTERSHFMNSFSGLCITSPSQKPEKETAPLENRRYGSNADLHNELVSSSTTVSQGMLHCIWGNETPSFVFSLDDQNEVYIATSSKAVSSDEPYLDYKYLFHSRTGGGKKEYGACSNAFNLVGKMKVSSSFTLSSNKSKLRETQFVLFGMEEEYIGEKQSSTPIHKKSRRLPKKVVNGCRTKKLSKHYSLPNFGILNKIEELGRINFVEGDLPSNLELAAIVVKNHTHDKCRESEVGGWGMKFLEKVKMDRTNSSLGASVSFGSSEESCLQNKNDCSASMDIIVPAGFHGGPRTGNGSPSSLIERWRSGGHCDCGGWDIGCPITVLSNRSRRELNLKEDEQKECNSNDVFIQGGEQGLPSLKMVKIHEDLYIIHFESTLSPLQSFSIGIATIHTHNPTMFQKCTEFEAKRTPI